MKVLLIDVNCKYSSTGKIVYDLYSELNKNGHTAAICYGRGPLVEETNIYKFSSDIETYIHAFMTRMTGLTGVFSPTSTRRLLKYIKEFKPDVVHIHELHGYFVNIAPVMKYLKKNKIKTVWTFHCEFMYTGKCGHAHACDKWRTECGNCPLLHEYPKSLFFDFTKYMFNRKKELFSDFENLTIVTPSNWLADRVRISFLKGKDIRVIHNGIDIENVFHSRNSDLLKEKHNLTNEKIILAVAPNLMSEDKGGKWILEIANRLRTENIKFILIGIDDLTKNFSDNIIALGRTENQTELAEYYSMADIFVICSKRENFPTTCLEAIACGTPIVGFDAGGTKETAPEGYGCFVEYGDIESISKEIRLILKGDSVLSSKNECAKYGKEKYSKQSMYSTYFKLYQK